MLKEISQIRVMGSDPRRWPKVPSEVELKAVLQRIYGFPDEYALKTYHSDLSNERKPLAIESKIFISQHVLAEQVAINSALKMLSLYANYS